VRMLTATELFMHEPVPIHRVQEAIFEFCRGHADVVVFGAQAVNVYAPIARMTQDVDLLSSHPREIAEALAQAVGDHFHIAARVREVHPPARGSESTRCVEKAIVTLPKSGSPSSLSTIRSNATA
jgi:hypothetical protein